MKEITIHVKPWYLWLGGAIIAINAGVLVFIRVTMQTVLGIWFMLLLMLISLGAVTVLASLAYYAINYMLNQASRESMNASIRDRQHSILMDLPAEKFAEVTQGLVPRNQSR